MNSEPVKARIEQVLSAFATEMAKIGQRMDKLESSKPPAPRPEKIADAVEALLTPDRISALRGKAESMMGAPGKIVSDVATKPNIEATSRDGRNGLTAGEIAMRVYEAAGVLLGQPNAKETEWLVSERDGAIREFQEISRQLAQELEAHAVDKETAERAADKVETLGVLVGWDGHSHGQGHEEAFTAVHGFLGAVRKFAAGIVPEGVDRRSPLPVLMKAAVEAVGGLKEGSEIKDRANREISLVLQELREKLASLKEQLVVATDSKEGKIVVDGLEIGVRFFGALEVEVPDGHVYMKENGDAAHYATP